MLSVLKSFESKKNDLGLLILRLFLALRLIYGVVDNIFSWEHMLAFSSFLDANDFPIPLISAVISVYAQFICGLLVLVGFRAREAAAVLVVNFIPALVLHINAGDSVEAITPALAMFFISVALVLLGAGKYALQK